LGNIHRQFRPYFSPKRHPIGRTIVGEKSQSHEPSKAPKVTETILRCFISKFLQFICKYLNFLFLFSHFFNLLCIWPLCPIANRIQYFRGPNKQLTSRSRAPCFKSSKFNFKPSFSPYNAQSFRKLNAD
jgi:hypothetical protein